MRNIVRFDKINLKLHPELNEKWVQEQIALDPSILELGEVVIRDKERIQRGAGRLDLLLQEVDGTRRYEVEIQLGKTDESHIIRTIEYWDIERKRYPNYDHCAVIIAEDITSRFLNVIQLFNGFIPIIALQMSAYKVEDDKIGLVFNKVVDELKLGLDDEEDVQETVDRSYWENVSSKEILKIADELLDVMKEFDPDIEYKYNKYYIGIVRQGQPFNFVILRPKKNNLRIEVRLDRSDEIENKLETSKLDVMEYNSRKKRYRIRLTSNDIKGNKELLRELLYEAYIGNS